MLVFSNPYKWEGDSAVIQILVFTSQEVKDDFVEKYNHANRLHTSSDFPAENGIGAVFKIRAVKNGMGKWDAVVRCGFTGGILCERANAALTPQDALVNAVSLLRTKLSEDCVYAEEISMKFVNDSLSNKPTFQ